SPAPAPAPGTAPAPAPAPAGAVRGSRSSAHGPLSARWAMRATPDPEWDRAQRRRLELLSAMALGYPFQQRLAGTAAASWADRNLEGGAGPAKPALVAALAGRLAPVVAAWLAIDSDEVDVGVFEGHGWGEVGPSPSGSQNRWSVDLPLEWLATVWAAGLA
ncbi:MAG: hypothetical protein ACRDY2_13565, partial [Acidimicrobiales bacterium]